MKSLNINALSNIQGGERPASAIWGARAACLMMGLAIGGAGVLIAGPLGALAGSAANAGCQAMVSHA